VREEMVTDKQSLENLPYVKMNPLNRFISIFYAPKETFLSLTRSKWVFVIPIIVIYAVGMICYPAMKSYLVEDQVSKLENNPLLDRLPEEQKRETIEQTRKAILDPPVWQLALGLVWQAAATFVVAGVLFLIGSTFLGGSTSYRGMLHVYSFAALVSVPEGIIKTVLIVAKKSMDVRTSLAVFLPGNDTTSMLFSLLNKIDIFSIWMVSLVVIGMSVFVPTVSPKKLAIWVVAFWVIWIVISAAVSSFAGGAFGL
jgi:hypothetical protein